MKKTTKKGRTSLYLSEVLLNKIRYIGWKEDKFLTEIMEQALWQFVARWEVEKGHIPPPLKETEKEKQYLSGDLIEQALWEGITRGRLDKKTKK